MLGSGVGLRGVSLFKRHLLHSKHGISGARIVRASRKRSVSVLYLLGFSVELEVAVLTCIVA